MPYIHHHTIVVTHHSTPAVKCNPDPVIVQALAILGVNFDCASRNEIRLVETISKDLPRKPDIIFANPCKAPAHIAEAATKGVHLMTFDNVAEIEKIASISKQAQLILRIVTDDRGSTVRVRLFVVVCFCCAVFYPEAHA
jgi:ornithine decarboxylase